MCFQESDPENKISVKECMQKFQRMASESALQKVHLPGSKKRWDKVSESMTIISLYFLFIIIYIRFLLLVAM